MTWDFPYPQNPGATHYQDCYMDKGHHNCAIVRVRHLEARVEQLQQELRDAQEKL
jgi:hypothetical protein